VDRQLTLHNRLAALVAALLVAVPAGTAGAQAPAPDVVRMPLGEALRVALENNLDLVLARKEPRIAEQGVQAQEAAFDPLLSMGPSANGYKREPRFVFEQPGRGSTVGIGAEWSQRLRFGADYAVALNPTRSEGSSVLFEPFYQTSLQMRFNMPLLRGYGQEPTLEQVLVARKNLEISREELRGQAEATLDSVEAAYWDLTAAHENLRVARESLNLARELYELNKRKVEVGTLAPIEITQAEAGVASREEAVIVAETGLANAEDALRRLMAVPQGDALWEASILTTDAPAFDPRSVDLDAAISVALERRPELSGSRLNVQRRELNERVAKNTLRPGLDLQVSLTPFGNNLKEAIMLPGGELGFVTGGLGTSVSEIPDLNNYNWSTGLFLAIPIGNRAAKASYATAVLERERAEVSLARTEQDIRVDVRRAARAVESGAKRVSAASSNVVLQRKKLEAEQKKFENGMSTSFEVLTFQNDLAEAEVAVIRAVVDYNKALAALERAQGTLIEARGLRLEE
jgi:outer membrane protein